MNTIWDRNRRCRPARQKRRWGERMFPSRPESIPLLHFCGEPIPCPGQALRGCDRFRQPAGFAGQRKRHSARHRMRDRALGPSAEEGRRTRRGLRWAPLAQAWRGNVHPRKEELVSRAGHQLKINLSPWGILPQSIPANRRPWKARWCSPFSEGCRLQGQSGSRPHNR